MELKKPITREEAKEKALTELLGELQKSYNECLEEINKSLVELEKLRIEYGACSNESNSQIYKNKISELDGEIKIKERKLLNIETNILKITD